MDTHTKKMAQTMVALVVSGSADAGVSHRCMGRCRVLNSYKPPLYFARLLMFFLLSLIATSYVRLAGAQGNSTIKVLSLLYHPMVPKSFGNALYCGFSASMAARNYTVSAGAKIQVITPPSTDEPVIEFLNKTAHKHRDGLLVVVGPFGDSNVIEAIPILRRHRIVAFSPYTGSGAVRGWNPNLYFLTADPTGEVIALIRYSLTQLRVKRLGFMYLKGLDFGDKEYVKAVSLMSQMGFQFSSVFALNSSLRQQANNSHFDETWEVFAASRPQAVIVFGAPILDTMKFLVAILKDNRTSKTILLASSTVQIIIVAVWREALNSAGAKFVPGQVVIAGNTPLAKNEKYKAMYRFQRDMRAYLSTDEGASFFNDTEHFMHDDISGVFMVHGWLAGEVLSRALRGREWMMGRRAFMYSLYDQRRYVIDDLVFGDFGGVCGATAESQGAVCRCNQGGNTVFVKELMADGRMKIVDGGDVILQASNCDSRKVVLYAPFDSIIFYMKDDSVALNAGKALYSGASSLSGNGRLGSGDRLFVHPINGTLVGAAGQLQLEREVKLLAGVFGVVSDEMLAVPGVVFIDPLTMVPRLNRGQRNVIHLSPTVEQQFFVLSMYLETIGGRLHAVLRTNEGDEMLEILEKSLVSFGMSLTSATVLGVDTPL
ncbi:hypothetical protein, conserved, partial [Trypanosoma vivax Y486]